VISDVQGVNLVLFLPSPRRVGHNLGVRRNVAFGDEVTRLWRRHQHADLPARLQGVLVGGVDLAALDVDLADCIGTWRAGGGSLDDSRRRDLIQGVDALDAVLPLLTSRVESLYFGRLRQLATLALES